MTRRLDRVLVTGGAGFVGSWVVERLLAREPAALVVVLDALTYAGDRANLPDDPRVVFVHGDVRDRALGASLIGDHGLTTVLHVAAESHVDRSIDGPLAFLETNVTGTATLLEAAWSVWRDAEPAACRFHLVSTDEVYGDRDGDTPPAREGDAYLPSSPYAASKAAADHLVWAWRRTWGVPVSITWGSNTWGPRQYPEKLIPVVLRQALRGEPIPVYGDGRQVRDWLHVADHADGILAAASVGAEGRGWNLGGDAPRRNLELVHALCAALDRLRPEGAPHARHVAFVPDRPGHDRRYALDSRRAHDELGWRPVRSLDADLDATVAWFAERLG